MPDKQLTPDQINALAAATANYNAQLLKSKQLAGDLVDEYDIIEKSLDDISKLINNQLKQQGASTRQISEIKSIYNSLTKTNKELQYLSEQRYDGTLKTKDITKQLNNLDKAEMSIRRQILLAEGKGEKTLALKFKKQLRILDLERTEAITLKSHNESIDKRVGLTGSLLEGLAKIPIIGDAIDFEEINTSMRSAAGNSNVFAAGLKTAGNQLKAGLKDPLVQVALLTAFYGKLMKTAYAFDETLTKTARTLAISKEQSEELYNTQFKYASSQHDSFVTAKMIQESQNKLNETLGISINLGDKNAETFSRLTHYYGMSEESAAKLVELSVEQGINSEDLLNNTLKTAVNTKAQIGGSISYQEVLKKVSNTGADILIKFKGNTEALTKAVIQANRLGISLEQVDQVGESLLNFESSIENELKAELLTGKAINLEKARAAALTGDQVTLMKEISTQVGGIHEFEKLNVIQRKAYSEAFGMDVKGMSEMLRKKEFENKLAGSNAKTAKEQLEFADKNGIKVEESLRNSLEAKSLADEQKETFTKLNEIIGKIVKGPMSKFLHMIEKVLEKVNGIMTSISKFTGSDVGSYLGVAIMSAPLLIGATRLFTGGIKGLLTQRGSPMNPMYVVNEGGMIGGGGKGGFIAGGTGMLSKRGLVGRFGAQGTRNLIGGAKGFGVGMALGFGADLAASGMEEGSNAKAITKGIGTTAKFAGTGAMIGSFVGPIGTAVGAIIGGSIGAIKSYFDAENERRERDKAEKEEQKASANRIDKLVQSVSDISQRPLVFNAGTDTIGRLQTAQRQYGAPSIAG